jgi:myo-inositol-1(or 4)-monophosphatase
MDLPTHADLLEFALATARAAGEAILPHFRAALEVADKGGGKGYDPVTVADHAAETVIRSAIARAYPDHGIHGEEHGKEQGTSKYTWVIDPIDGTRSFILGQMHWATLIALHDGSGVVVGVAHQPYVGESFLAAAGGPSEWRRGSERRTLKTRRCGSVVDAVVACTDPKMFRLQGERAAFDRIADRARLTRWGGDCYAYCLLAMGLIDIVIEAGLHPYDVQALMPIVGEAGGTITTWGGGRPDEGGSIVACGDRTLHAEVLRVLALPSG